MAHVCYSRIVVWLKAVILFWCELPWSALTCRSMAPKLQPTKLAHVRPTSEELEQVRKEMTDMDKDEKKARVNSMLHFNKKTEDIDAKASRGQERENFLEAFMVWQLRQKHARRTTTSVKETTTTDAKGKTIDWVSCEQMDRVVGEIRGKSLRESNHLKHMPCPITGKDCEFMRLWKLPQDWEKMSQEDLDKYALVAETDADEHSMITYRDCRCMLAYTPIVLSASTCVSTCHYFHFICRLSLLCILVLY